MPKYQKRFRVALSFPGEKREFILQVAEILSSLFGREGILYDDYFTAELARPDLDLYLSALYREHSELVVPFFSTGYEIKKWCKLEWRQMRDILFNLEGHQIMPFRFDDTTVSGTLSIDGYVQVGNRTPQEIAKLICERLDSPSREEHFSNENAFRMTTPHAVDVQPLHIAEDRFLQLLLSKFTLTRHDGILGPSFELFVEFDDNTSAIWDQNGKRYLREILTEDKRERFQKSLDEFFAGRGVNPYEVDDPEFFFRYASGGTLVMVEFEGGQHPNQYYCFFYRDVHPIGWNIANGGTDTRSELLNPQETIDRELREELIIADFVNRERYVFSADEEKPFDHPTHAAARRLWKRKFPDRDLNALKAVPVNISPQVGPDSLRVKMGGYDKEFRRDGFYLNVNGKDFGIEFDCVATIHGLPRHITLLDGEIDGGRLVNRPLGLFEVERFDERLRLGEEMYVPDFFYFGDKRYDVGSEITKVLETFIHHVRPIRKPKEIQEVEEAIKANGHLGLCPVTKKIANRTLRAKARSS